MKNVLNVRLIIYSLEKLANKFNCLFPVRKESIKAMDSACHVRMDANNVIRISATLA